MTKKIKINTTQLFLLLILLSTQLFSCAILYNGSISAKIDYYLQYYTDNNLFSGAVLVAKDDSIIIEKGYGYANKKNKTKFSQNTKTKLASVSKILTAIAILKMYQNGQLDLQDSIIKYFPKVNVNPKVTIDNLLGMNSGFSDVIQNNIVNPNFQNNTLNTFYTRQQIDTIIEEKILKSDENGVNYSYNNTNYYLLARIVEQISGGTLDNYLQNNLFSILGMTNTFIADGSNDDMIDVAIGHSITPYGLNYAEEINESYALGYGSAISTVHDYYLLDKELYTTSILNESNKNLMFTIKIQSTGNSCSIFNSNYGYGVMIDEAFSINGKTHKVIHHGGNFMGYSNYYARFPDDHTVIILFANIGEETIRESMIYDIASFVFE